MWYTYHVVMDKIVVRSIMELRDAIQNFLDDGRKGEMIKDGIRVTLFGAPNAGKSSLLNALGKSN
jgi:tRNA U34 5-carboxymethylaminomethyl modifying GTPase MnmE/TrmE